MIVETYVFDTAKGMTVTGHLKQTVFIKFIYKKRLYGTRQFFLLLIAFLYAKSISNSVHFSQVVSCPSLILYCLTPVLQEKLLNVRNFINFFEIHIFRNIAYGPPVEIYPCPASPASIMTDEAMSLWKKA